AFVDSLRDLVSIDSGNRSRSGVNRVADALQARFHEDGWTTERRPNDGLGDLLLARIEGTGSHRVVLVCHMDTVVDDGTAAARPFLVDESGRGLGPGVSDAKSRLLAGIDAVSALRATGADR